VNDAMFWASFDRTGECWNWTKAVNNTGRGHVRRGKRTALAHRVAWELTFGPIPTGMDVCHHCDNGLCGRPDHLFLGTAKDNMRDAAAKGRMASVLSTADVQAIRSIPSRRVLALQYGVSVNTIAAIQNGRARQAVVA
jgi:hypothetical protein